MNQLIFQEQHLEIDNMNQYDKWREEDEEREKNRHSHDTENQSKDCKHDMEYSGTLGIVGGRCRKCGYKTY